MEKDDCHDGHEHEEVDEDESKTIVESEHEHHDSVFQAKKNREWTWKSIFKLINIRDPDKPIKEKELRNPYS